MDNLVAKPVNDAMKLVFGYSGIDNKTVLVVPGLSEDEARNISNEIASSSQPFVEIALDSRSNDILLINKTYLVFFFAMPCNSEEENKKSDKSKNNSHFDKGTNKFKKP